MAATSPAAPAASPQSDAEADRALRPLLVVVVLGGFLSVLDMTIVNVAIDELGTQLDSPVSTVQWVTTAYMLALAGTVPVSAWLARRLGKKRLYIGTLVTFTVASALCGLAWSIGSLVAFRVLQGASGGLLLPVGQMILAQAAPPSRLRRAMSVVGTVSVIAPIVGPILGGVILDVSSWHWIFFVNVPIGVLGGLLAFRLLPADAGGDAGPIDLLGLVTLGVGLPALTYALTQLGGGADPWALGSLPMLAVGVGLIAVFIAHARRAAHPLLNLRLYRDRAFAAAALLSALLGGAVFGPYLLIPLFYQEVQGLGPVAAGALFAAQGVGAAIGIQLVGRVSHHIHGGLLATIGAVVMTLFTIPLAFIEADSSRVLLTATLVLRGLGIGLAFIPAITSALAVLRRDQIPDASSQLSVLQRVGGSIATALLTATLAASAGGDATAIGGYRATFAWAAALAALTIPVSAVLLRIERRRA